MDQTLRYGLDITGHSWIEYSGMDREMDGILMVGMDVIWY